MDSLALVRILRHRADTIHTHEVKTVVKEKLRVALYNCGYLGWALKKSIYCPTSISYMDATLLHQVIGSLHTYTISLGIIQPDFHTEL